LTGPKARATTNMRSVPRSPDDSPNVGAVATPPLVHPQLGQPVAVYRYENAAGSCCFVQARFEPKDFRPAQLKASRWVWNLSGAPVLPYRLPRVQVGLEVGATIDIVDGEKDADAIEAAGGYATCCARPQGWTLEHSEQLTGARRVRIVVDRDNGAGARQAREVAASLDEAGAVASSDIDFVQAREGKDAADHLAAGYGLDDFEPFDFPAAAASTEAGAFRIVSLDVFLDVEDEPSVPAIGAPGETLLPIGGLLIMGGDGGASKTTLTLDAVAHLASGTTWLGYEVQRPLRVLLIENEGPRAFFREKLRSKADTWQGRPWRPNVSILDEPWAGVNFAREDHRERLRSFVREHEIDLVVADPLDSLGIAGAGKPEETREFVHWLRELGLHDPHNPLTFWILHHFSKTPQKSVVQALSGSWGGHPDAILGVELGDGQTTKLTWGKLRHATPPADKVTILSWDVATRGFAAVPKAEPPDHDELRERVREYVEGQPGAPQSEIEAEIGGRRERVREALSWWASDEGSRLLALGPGRAANGKYWYPASHAVLSSPGANGATSGESDDSPAEGPCSPARPDPRRGEGGASGASERPAGAGAADVDSDHAPRLAAHGRVGQELGLHGHLSR
jgi:AAA domain